jgi:hypothetical protein
MMSEAIDQDGYDDDELRNQVATLTEQLPPLTLQIEESNKRAAQARRLTLWHAAMTCLVCILLVCIAVMFVKQRESANQLRDCIVPTGKCAQRSAKTTAAVVSSIALRGERERIRTELPIAEAKDDDVRVGALKSRLSDLEQQIGKVDSDIAVIQQQNKSTGSSK